MKEALVKNEAVLGHVGELFHCILNEGAVQATKYIRPDFIVRATRKLFHGKIYRRENPEVLVTIGEPNFAEREFIKKNMKLGMVFPVAEIQKKFLKKK